MVILPVDQGFEHGPARSFSPNPESYDPHYHWRLAIDAGLNAFASPLGMIEAGADTFAGAIPTILKVNSANSHSVTKDQAVTASVQDALRLGCSAIGFTIYPGSESQFEMTKDGETAVDVTAYAAHIAALLGAHIIKVKPPADFLEQDEAA